MSKQSNNKLQLDCSDPRKPGKRRRVEVTAGMKKQICEYKRDHPTVSLGVIQKWASDELSASIGKSTVGDIVRSSDKWLQVSLDGCAGKRVRVAKHDELDAALFMWFSDMGHETISRHCFCHKTNNSNRFLR